MQKKAPRKGDDRNLVLVDQDFGQPDLEDRMFLFWVRNKASILGVIALAIAGCVGALIFAAFSSHRLAVLQGEYVAAKFTGKPEALLAFAKANEGKPLAFVAALEAADQLFASKKYDEASKAYALAAVPAGDGKGLVSALSGRASLGNAFSELSAGRVAQAEVIFTSIQGNAVFPVGVRGQALHSLALLAIERKDLASARKYLDTMDKILPKEDPWLFAKNSLLEQVPALLAPAVAAEPTTAPASTGTAPAAAAPANAPAAAEVAPVAPAPAEVAPTAPAPVPAASAAPAAPVPVESVPAPAPAAPVPAPAAPAPAPAQ